MKKKPFCDDLVSTGRLGPSKQYTVRLSLDDMIDQRDFAIVETVVEMYLNKSYPVLAEDKEAVSEGESGGSSEDHQDRLHHHHQHFPAHPGLRGED